MALIIGLFLSFNAEIMQRSQDKQNIELALKEALIKFESQITKRLIFYSYGLKSIDSLLSAIGSKNFDDKTMQSFARSRDFQTEFPGVRGFGVIQNVAAKDLDSFVAKQRALREDKTFNVKHLSDNYKDLFIIRDIKPESKNASAIGLNIGSEQLRQSAAIESAAKNKITITAPITLVQADKSIKQGFLILLPFYERGLNTKHSALGVQNTWGWSYAPIVIDEVVRSANVINNNLMFSISNIDATGNTLFYQSGEIEQQQGSYHFHYNVAIFGKNWRFEAHTSPAFIDNIKQPSYTAFKQSITVTFLAAISLFCIHLIILKRFEAKTHIAQLAIAKEQALKQTNKELESLVISRTRLIEKSASFQKAILQSSAYSIMSTDENGLITVFNPAAEALLGYQASDIIGKQTPEKFHLLKEIVNKAKLLSKEMNMNIEPGFDVFKYKATLFGKEESDWTYVHRNGTHIRVKLSVTCLYDDSNKIIGFLGIAYDLTEQLRNEKIIKQEKENAESATLAKSQFLANMSHEIRTPLNGVQGALQILQGKPLSNELSTLVNIALSSMKTLSVLVNDILDISKVEAGKIQLSSNVFRLDEMLNSLVQEFNKSAEYKGITLHFENNLTHTTWLGDDLRIKQILINLISNAIKFTEQGMVKVHVDYGMPNGLKVTIDDTGIGMTTAGLSVLFNRFEQADKSITRKFGGSGLGMAITKSLVDLMEGTITVSSEINVGTTFEIYLPLKPIDDDIVAVSDVSQAKLDLSNFSILVAEDNEINQIIIQTMLSDIGVNVVIAENGQQAIDKAISTNFDLVLLDIQMPVLDGIQACISIKKVHPNIPIIALTANVFAEDIEAYKRTGFDSFMGKPFEKDELIKLVYSYLS